MHTRLYLLPRCPVCGGAIIDQYNVADRTTGSVLNTFWIVPLRGVPRGLFFVRTHLVRRHPWGTRPPLSIENLFPLLDRIGEVTSSL